ncbi:hypothetical protein [Streptomyces sp. 1114.5]|nr:hypothetical protein [Streptomyces sp. 1114.5]
MGPVIARALGVSQRTMNRKATDLMLHQLGPSDLSGAPPAQGAQAG